MFRQIKFPGNEIPNQNDRAKQGKKEIDPPPELPAISPTHLKYSINLLFPRLQDTRHAKVVYFGYIFQDTINRWQCYNICIKGVPDMPPI